MSFNDTVICAYLLEVDGKPHHLVRMRRHSEYGFCYWPERPGSWRRFLPKEWKSFQVLDIPRQEWICGSVRATA